MRLLLVLAVLSTAGLGLDLTTFRQSYSRASRADWWLWVDAGIYDRTGYRALQAGDLHASLDWKTSIVSDELDLDATASADASGSGQNVGLRDTVMAESRNWSSGLRLGSAAKCHAFLFQTDAFVRGGFDLSGDAALTDARRCALDADLSDGELGVGYGRMRDAAPLLKAVRLTRIMREDGVLQRELTDDDLRDLGGFLSRAWKLFYAHDRAAKFYYDSLEQRLLSAGAINEPLPAYTLFHMDEAPLIGTDTRRFGWRAFLTANIGVHTRKEWHREADTSWAELDTSSYRSYRIGGEFSRLVGVHWAYGGSAVYILPWPRRSDGVTQQQAQLQGSVSYDLTDRLAASYTLDIAPSYSLGPTRYHYRHLALPSDHELVFSYYISQRFAVRLGGRYETRFDSQDNWYDHRYDFRHRWAAALTMTFGRIPADWGMHYYL
jgi:hypothetical protein